MDFENNYNWYFMFIANDFVKLKMKTFIGKFRLLQVGIRVLV